MDGKTVKESRVTIGLMMGPEHANPLGNVHGGIIMRLADEAGALAAMRHARSPVVTVAIDSMTFLEPITVGYLVTFHAELTYTGRTSMEASVKVIAENPITGQQTKTNQAYMVYVAIDEHGRPKEVPPLIAETKEEQRMLAQGKARQARRLEQRLAEQANG